MVRRQKGQKRRSTPQELKRQIQAVMDYQRYLDETFESRLQTASQQGQVQPLRLS